MIRINLTDEEYESLVLMMGLHAGSLMKDDIELAKKVVSLYVSIVGKKETFITPEESKHRKTVKSKLKGSEARDQIKH